MAQAGDMIVNLTTLPPLCTKAEGVFIKRALAVDREKILNFVKENFQSGWACEAECALMHCPGRCFIAVENGRLLGFACYDATAKGFFGPIGVSKNGRGKNTGTALLLRTLYAMREEGYGYAVLGWVTGEAEGFYRKTVHAQFIPGASPENSVYSNLISL